MPSEQTVRITALKDDINGMCECGEDTAGPNYCGHCGKRIVWIGNLVELGYAEAERLDNES